MGIPVDGEWSIFSVIGYIWSLYDSDDVAAVTIFYVYDGDDDGQQRHDRR